MLSNSKALETTTCSLVRARWA